MQTRRSKSLIMIFDLELEQEPGEIRNVHTGREMIESWNTRLGGTGWTGDKGRGKNDSGKSEIMWRQESKDRFQDQTCCQGMIDNQLARSQRVLEKVRELVETNELQLCEGWSRSARDRSTGTPACVERTLVLKSSVDGCQSTQSQPFLTCSPEQNGVPAGHKRVPDERKNPTKWVAAKGQHRPNAN